MIQCLPSIMDKGNRVLGMQETALFLFDCRRKALWFRPLFKTFRFYLFFSKPAVGWASSR
jgi:hypothetical protein